MELLKVAVGSIEDEESDNNASEGTPEMSRVTPEVFVESIEDIPNPAPDKHESDDDGKIVSEIANQVLARGRVMLMMVLFVHDANCIIPFLLRECA